MKLQLTKHLQQMKWGAVFSLAIIYVSAFTQHYWLWGVLLLYWASLDLISNQCWLGQIIMKKSNPFLYYLIVLTWLTMGFYFLLSPVIYLLR